MKHILTFLSFMIAFVTPCSGQNNVRLVALDGTLFNVKVKNKLINKTAQNSVLIEHISEDTLAITIDFEDNTTVEIPVYLLEKGKKCNGKELNYKIETSQKPVKLVFSGIYDIKPVPAPLVPVKPIVDTMPSYKNRFMGHLCELKNGDPTYFNNIPKDRKCEIKMPDQYLDHVKVLMKKAQVEDDKYDIIENVCRNNCISVAQCSVLLNYIGFEIEKLKLVKIAYFNLTDPENAKNLETCFKFDASKEELKKFLKNPKEYYLQSGTHCKTPSDSVEMNKLYSTLAVLANDAERYLDFKKTYTIYCYSMNQVRKIMTLFIHDREKSDVAKALYFYCTEKENYEKILELFAYNESKNMLRNFIEKQGK